MKSRDVFASRLRDRASTSNDLQRAFRALPDVQSHAQPYASIDTHSQVIEVDNLDIPTLIQVIDSVSLSPDGGTVGYVRFVSS